MTTRFEHRTTATRIKHLDGTYEAAVEHSWLTRTHGRAGRRTGTIYTADGTRAYACRRGPKNTVWFVIRQVRDARCQDAPRLMAEAIAEAERAAGWDASR